MLRRLENNTVSIHVSIFPHGFFCVFPSVKKVHMPQAATSQRTIIITSHIRLISKHSCGHRTTTWASESHSSPILPVLCVTSVPITPSIENQYQVKRLGHDVYLLTLNGPPDEANQNALEYPTGFSENWTLGAPPPLQRPVRLALKDQLLFRIPNVRSFLRMNWTSSLVFVAVWIWMWQLEDLDGLIVR